MLKRIYADNYKCLVNFEVRLAELVVLLGPNGAGKSAVCDLLFALRQLLSGKAAVKDVFSDRTLTRWDKRDKQVVEIAVALEGEELTYRLEIEHEREAKRARIALERLLAPDATLFEFEGGEVRLYDDRGKHGASFPADWTESFLARVVPRKENKRLTRFLEKIRKMVICGIYPGSMVAESSREATQLARNASDFSSWYRHVLQERPDLVPGFTKALGKAIEGLKALRLEKVGEETRSLMALFGVGGSTYELRLEEISDGERALTVLYALLHLTRGQGYTLVLDEPDNYLALSEIQPWLVELSDSSGDELGQAILCSHHPEVIDYLGPEHGVLLERREGGPAIARPLAEVKPETGLKLSELVARGWLS
mgnify:CR=1 FL=1